MKKMLHIGLSTGNNGHAIGLKQVFNVGDWQYEDINVAEPDLNTKIIDIANNYRPDLVFIQIQSSGLHREAIEALKANGAWILNWCGDKRNRVDDFYFHYMQFGVDLTCFSNTEDIEIMRKCGYQSDWLQIGYDPAIYSPDGPVDKRADIVFMGNNFSHFPLSGMRRDMIKELKRVYGDNFKSFGSGMPDGSLMGNQPGEAAVYRGAKIGINLSHFDSDRYSSDRLFRMLGCSVCVLSHNYQGIEKDFMHGHDLVVWNDINDLKRLINELLIDENPRQKIARNGHELAVNNYTFFHMGQKVLELYNKYHK